MKKIVLLFAVFAGALLSTSCTDQNSDESEFKQIISNTDGEDEQASDNTPPPPHP